MTRRGKRPKNATSIGVITATALFATLYVALKAITLSALVLVAFAIFFMIALAWTAAAVYARFFRQRSANLLARRRSDLLEKYRDPMIVRKILAGDIWHDMTKEQLIDSWGKPDDIDVLVARGHFKEIYKYDPWGSNRFGTRAFLENDAVVGWQKR